MIISINETAYTFVIIMLCLILNFVKNFLKIFSTHGYSTLLIDIVILVQPLYLER